MNKLRRIVARLRKECPWDRKQTVFSTAHSVLEEAYELVQAIRERDYEKMAEETGDHIFVGLFVAQILEDTGKASVDEVLNGITEKLIGRHPHIFAKHRVPMTSDEFSSSRPGSPLSRVRTAEDVLDNWSKIKAWERRKKGRAVSDQSSALDGVPKALPALQRATSIQLRAKRVGFDWKDPRDVLDKVIEEVEEIRAELRRPAKERRPKGAGRGTANQKGNVGSRRTPKQRRVSEARVQEELGDLLFAIANMSRHLDIDAEDALQRATDKFAERFRKMERTLTRQGRKLDDFTLEEMDAEWDRVKARERRRRRNAV